MSDRGDSTRDWLLKKLLKAKESLVEQARELKTIISERDKLQKDITNAGRELWQLSEKLDDANIELQRLKRVPPIAPNLEVIYHTQRGNAYPCRVLAVQSANGHTTIQVEWAGPLNRRLRDEEERQPEEWVG